MPCVVLRFHPFFVRRRAKRAQAQAAPTLQSSDLSISAAAPISASAPSPEVARKSDVFYDPLANYPYVDNSTNSVASTQPLSLDSQFQNFSPDNVIRIEHPRTPFSEPVDQLGPLVNATAPDLSITSTTDYSATVKTVPPMTSLTRFRQKLQTGATKIKDAHQVPVAEPLNIKPARFKRRMSHDDLLNEESRLGSTIFGPIPVGHHREFFHDHNNVWIWYESWRDDNRRHRQIIVRYEIRPTGVYKKFTAGKYTPLEGAELHNFRKATHAYLKVIREGLYGQVAPATIATV